MWRASRQWDDWNGSLDAEAHMSLMQAIDDVINRLPTQEYNMIHVHAKNLSAGSIVWRNPRIPQNMIERSRLLISARLMLGNAVAQLGFF